MDSQIYFRKTCEAKAHHIQAYNKQYIKHGH